MLMMTILKTCFCFNVCLYSCCTCSADCFIFDNLATISNHLEVFFFYIQGVGLCLSVKCFICKSLYICWNLCYHLSDQGTFTPVGAQGGGVHGIPKKTSFLTGILHFEKFKIFIWKILKIISASFFFFKFCTVWKWRPNNQFLVHVISILAKIWKTTFPKEFFSEIWLIVGEDE